MARTLVPETRTAVSFVILVMAKKGLEANKEEGRLQSVVWRKYVCSRTEMLKCFMEIFHKISAA